MSWFSSNDHHHWLTDHTMLQRRCAALICHLMSVLFETDLSSRKNKSKRELMLWTSIMIDFLFKNTFDFHWIIKIRSAFMRLSQFLIVILIAEIFLLCSIAFHFKLKIIFKLMTIQSLLTVYCSLSLMNIKIICQATWTKKI